MRQGQGECPLDRQRISVVCKNIAVRNMVERLCPRRRVTTAEGRRLDAQLDRFNRGQRTRVAAAEIPIQNQSSLLSELTDLIGLPRDLGVVSVLKWLWNLDPRWAVPMLLLYVVNPFDLFPEMLFGPIGFIDDLLAILLATVQLIRVFWFS
jgi:hypothetical protein